jgi:hypothetical protein
VAGHHASAREDIPRNQTKREAASRRCTRSRLLRLVPVCTMLNFAVPKKQPGCLIICHREQGITGSWLPYVMHYWQLATLCHALLAAGCLMSCITSSWLPYVMHYKQLAAWCHALQAAGYLMSCITSSWLPGVMLKGLLVGTMRCGLMCIAAPV